MKTIHERLAEIYPKITDPAFRVSKGMGNEVGYHIFDYDPEHEMIVRNHVSYIKERINKDHQEIFIREFDLYEIVIRDFRRKGLFRKELSNGTKKRQRVYFKCYAEVFAPHTEE